MSSSGEIKTIIGFLPWPEIAEIRAHTCCEDHYPLQLNAHALANAYQIAGPGFFHQQDTFQLEPVH